MVFSFFSAYGTSETETTENLFQFRSGSFEPSETLFPISREIRSRSFPFVFLQHLAILNINRQLFKTDLDPFKSGILCGSMTSGGSQLAYQYNRFHDKGVQKMSPLTILQTIHNSASSVLSIEHKIKGLSSGYNCMETSGIEAFCDALMLLDTPEYQDIFIGAGEDLINENQMLQQIGSVFLLTKRIPQNQNTSFEIKCQINRGKPWLNPNENLLDVLNTHFGNNRYDKIAKVEKEKWIIFNFQDFQKVFLLNYPIDIVEFPEFKSFLSVAPFLGISMGMQLYTEFKLLTISSEGHAVLISFKKVGF